MSGPPVWIYRSVPGGKSSRWVIFSGGNSRCLYCFIHSQCQSFPGSNNTGIKVSIRIALWSLYPWWSQVYWESCLPLLCAVSLWASSSAPRGRSFAALSSHGTCGCGSNRTRAAVPFQLRPLSMSRQTSHPLCRNGLLCVWKTMSLLAWSLGVEMKKTEAQTRGGHYQLLCLSTRSLCLSEKQKRLVWFP